VKAFKHRKQSDGKSVEPPCRTCPKYLLYPPGFGLMPENALAVDLYGKACADIRVGDGGYLVGTLTPEGAWAIINNYPQHFPHVYAKQRCFELMCILDSVATTIRSNQEEARRKAKMDEMESKHRIKRR